MKHLFVALLLLCRIGYAQITLEHTYTGPVWTQPMHMVHLTANGDKYVEMLSNQLIIYNLNHSVFRSIIIPNQPAGMNNYRVHWVSDELFNTNTADVEYILTYITMSTNLQHTLIYDENGNLLFSRDSFSLNDVIAPFGRREPEIVHTTNGSKMMLVNQYTYVTALCALPGVMPCTMCDQGVISGIQTQPSDSNGNEQQLPNP